MPGVCEIELYLLRSIFHRKWLKDARIETILKGKIMNKIPTRYVKFQNSYPDLFRAYEELGKQASNSGPLDKKQIALVKLGIACGAKMEGAVHSHCRRSLEAGASPDEIRHAVLLTVTTLGFPSMMACLSWVDEVLNAEC